jgi:hypothetical protein
MRTPTQLTPLDAAPRGDPSGTPRRSARSLRHAAAAVLLAAAASTAGAGSWTVFEDDLSGFQSALVSRPSSTVVDSGGAFAPDPVAGLVAAASRSGTVAGEAFSFTVYDVNFANAPTGTLTPGSPGGDVASSSQLTVETPVAQGSATGAGTFGYDSVGSTDSTASRNALLVDFTTTPGDLGVGHFALDLVDFEAAAAGAPGLLRLYGGGVLLFSHSFTFPGTGNNEVHFLGVVAADASSFFDQVVLVVGDDTAGLTGNSESWAADRFRFGVAHNPEPATWALFGVGALALGAGAARRRRGTRRAPPSSPRGASG